MDDYKLAKRGKGYKVIDTKTRHVFSKAPLPKARAERQLAHIKADTKK